jgi:hypothetical protein
MSLGATAASAETTRAVITVLRSVTRERRSPRAVLPAAVVPANDGTTHLPGNASQGLSDFRAIHLPRRTAVTAGRIPRATSVSGRAAAARPTCRAAGARSPGARAARARSPGARAARARSAGARAAGAGDTSAPSAPTTRTGLAPGRLCAGRTAFTAVIRWGSLLGTVGQYNDDEPDRDAVERGDHHRACVVREARMLGSHTLRPADCSRPDQRPAAPIERNAERLTARVPC